MPFKCQIKFDVPNLIDKGHDSWQNQYHSRNSRFRYNTHSLSLFLSPSPSLRLSLAHPLNLETCQTSVEKIKF